MPAPQIKHHLGYWWWPRGYGFWVSRIAHLVKAPSGPWRFRLCDSNVWHGPYDDWADVAQAAVTERALADEAFAARQPNLLMDGPPPSQWYREPLNEALENECRD